MADKFDYASKRLTAEKLINKFGENSTLSIEGNDGGFDAFGNPIASAPGSTIDCIITPILNYKESEIDGETIQRKDGYTYIYSDDAPQIQMTTTINGVKYAVIDVKELTSVTGVNLYYVLQLRV